MQNERTFLRHRHAVFDAQIAHRRHHCAADFAHRSRSGRRRECSRRAQELAKRYAETIVTETEPRHRATQELIRDYVLKNFTGENATDSARACCSSFFAARMRSRKCIAPSATSCTSAPAAKRFATRLAITSPTIHGKVTYFEPGVLAAFDPKAVERDLKLWAEFSDSDGGILDQVIRFPATARRSRRRWC